MIIKTYNTEDEWLDDRRPKVTGTKLGGIGEFRGQHKIGFYELIAARIALYEDGGTSDRDRGHRFEAEAVEQLSNLVGIDFITDRTMWVREDNDYMAYSPDGYSADLTVAAEVKNLGTAWHMFIIDTDQIPNDSKHPYYNQIIQAFIVNDDLEKVYFTSYDPRFTAKPLHVIVITREEAQEAIDYYRNLEERVLAEVEEYVERWAF